MPPSFAQVIDDGDCLLGEGDVIVQEWDFAAIAWKILVTKDTRADGTVFVTTTASDPDGNFVITFTVASAGYKVRLPVSSPRGRPLT